MRNIEKDREMLIKIEKYWKGREMLIKIEKCL